MQTFEIVYRENPRAPIQRKTVKGHAEVLVRREFEGQGFKVLAILALGDVDGGGVWKRILKGNIALSFRFGVNAGELALLCEVLRALYTSGVPMMQSLQIVIEETPNPWLKKRLVIALERIRDGVSIYDALSDPRCKKAFPPLMRETIRTGEAAGRLDTALARLAELFKRSSETKRQTVSALIYPVFALILFLVICGILAVKIPDALIGAVGEEDIYKILPQAPAVIRLLFFFRENPLYLLAPPLTITFVAVMWGVGKKFRATRIALTRVERKIPVLGNLLYQFALVRFLDLLSSNNESGIQVTESLSLMQGTVGDALIEESLGRMRSNILTEGAGLGEALSDPEEAPVYPGLVRQMVRAGEEAGRLTEMLLPIVDFYAEQAKAMLKRLLDLLTPVMIVMLGAVIGPVLLGVYKVIYLLQQLYAQ